MGRSLLENYREQHQHPLNRALHFVGIPLIVFSLIFFFFNWRLGLALFVLGWVFQFAGHFIEGNQPAFFKNPVYLLIGPLFVLRKVVNALRTIFTPRPAP